MRKIIAAAALSLGLVAPKILNELKALERKFSDLNDLPNDSIGVEFLDYSKDEQFKNHFQVKEKEHLYIFVNNFHTELTDFKLESNDSIDQPFEKIKQFYTAFITNMYKEVSDLQEI